MRSRIVFHRFSLWRFPDSGRRRRRDGIWTDGNSKRFFSQTFLARSVRWFNNALHRPFHAASETRQFVGGVRARARARSQSPRRGRAPGTALRAERREIIASAVSDFHFPTVPFIRYGPRSLYILLTSHRYAAVVYAVGQALLVPLVSPEVVVVVVLLSL